MKHETFEQYVDFKNSSELETRTDMQSGAEKRLLGVDVSSYQGEIDWQVVAQACVSFVFIKATEGRQFCRQKLCQKYERCTSSQNSPVVRTTFFIQEFR